MSEYELIERDARQALEHAGTYVVACDEDYTKAAEFVLACYERIRKVRDLLDDRKKKAHAAHKSVVALEKELIEPLEKAIEMVSAPAIRFKQAQDDLMLAERDPPEGRPTKLGLSVPKVPGLFTRRIWKARVVDSKKVIREYCKPDESIINISVQSKIDTITRRIPDEVITRLEAEIGGIEILSEEKFVARIDND